MKLQGEDLKELVLDKLMCLGLGQTPRPSQMEDLIEMWEIGLEGVEVSTKGLREAMKEFAQGKHSFFPSPGKFREIIMDIQGIPREDEMMKFFVGKAWQLFVDYKPLAVAKQPVMLPLSRFSSYPDPEGAQFSYWKEQLKFAIDAHREQHCTYERLGKQFIDYALIECIKTFHHTYKCTSRDGQTYLFHEFQGMYTKIAKGLNRERKARGIGAADEEVCQPTEKKHVRLQAPPPEPSDTDEEVCQLTEEKHAEIKQQIERAQERFKERERELNPIVVEGMPLAKQEEALQDLIKNLDQLEQMEGQLSETNQFRSLIEERKKSLLKEKKRLLKREVKNRDKSE